MSFLRAGALFSRIKHSAAQLGFWAPSFVYETLLLNRDSFLAQVSRSPSSYCTSPDTHRSRTLYGTNSDTPFITVATAPPSTAARSAARCTRACRSSTAV